ncbi:penicillin-binding protein [Candidatus Wolfebacteria bacterium]|nr:penicillin-binding protein [Candidatus Wolfebacteria bacterium]
MRKKKKGKKKNYFFLKITGLFFLIILIFGFWALIVVAKIAKDLPSPEQFVNKQINQSTKIYDRTGEILLYEIHGEEKRTLISFEEIPEFAKKATLAIEDQNFYTNPAFDWKAIARAMITNILKGRVVQGGSTITQQLAKNAFLTPEKTYTRKLKELILAHWIEQRYSKDEILNLYLNQIPYGSNAYGIEAASQTYFSKSAKDLNLSEAAVLAAMLQAPSYYSPWGSHSEELKHRKNYVLEQMFSLGFIDKEEKQRAENFELKFSQQNIGSIKAPHFIMIIKDYLNTNYGEETVEEGGLKVITTLDWNLQEIAEKTIKEGAEKNSELYQGKNAALVAQDPKTGQILAMVGSKDYFGDSEPEGCKSGLNCQFEGNFNVATQGLRQPGSALKPFAYFTAFQKGYSPETVVFDLPTEFSSYYELCPLININFLNNNNLCFHPENFDGIFRGPVNLRNSLAQSINVPSVKILYLAGLNNTLENLKNFGITTLSDPSRYGLSLVLGGGEIKLIELIEAYSVFAQEGIKHRQSLILEIKDSQGRVLEKYIDQAIRVAESQYTQIINNILSDIEARSGLFHSSLNLTVFPDREVALKTGTTNDYRDAWTIGYTPSLVVGVWAGNNDSRPMQKNAGSILAAIPIWHDFMEKAINNQTPEFFNKPEEIIQTKPMLNGEYIIDGDAHNILYYVNKNNPTDTTPFNTGFDSQFQNWEIPVRIWLQSLRG